MIEVIRENKKLYIIWMISIVLISISTFVSGITSGVALLLVMLTILFDAEDDSIVLLFGILPFANIFKINPGNLSFFTICELFYVVVKTIKRKKISKCMLLGSFVLFMYITICSYKAFNILTIIKLFVGFYLIYYAKFLSGKDIKNIAYLLSFSTIIMMLLSSNSRYFTYIIPYLEDLNYYVDTTGHATEIMRNSGFIGDPNYCSMLIIITLTLLTTLYYFKDVKNEFWLILIVLIPMGFLTYSKSYFLCITVFVIYLLVFVLFPKHKRWACVAILAIGTVVYYALMGKFEVINLIFDRFSVGNITTGRSSLNHEYLEYIFSNLKVLLFGEGIGVERFLGARNNVHNFYIDLLFKLGIVGVGIYITMLYSALKKPLLIYKNRKKYIVEYISTIFLLVMYYFLSGVLNYAFPFYVIICYLGYNYHDISSREEIGVVK